MNKKAFTLIELLVVVLIIGILAAIAVPQYQKAVDKSRAMELVVASKAIADEQQAYYMANGVYAEQAEDITSYPKKYSSGVQVGKGYCGLGYSNDKNSERVSCGLTKPHIVLQREYKNGRLTCCSYDDDNYKGDGACSLIIRKSSWYNGCSEASPCHCYNE